MLTTAWCGRPDTDAKWLKVNKWAKSGGGLTRQRIGSYERYGLNVQQGFQLKCGVTECLALETSPITMRSPIDRRIGLSASSGADASVMKEGGQTDDKNL
jgi:hypothetical protein